MIIACVPWNRRAIYMAWQQKLHDIKEWTGTGLVG